MQIPVFETIAAAYRFLLDERRDFLAYAALPIVAVALAQVLFLLTLAGADETEGSGGLGLVRAGIVAVSVVTYVMFAVAWHRRYLAENPAPTVGEALRWSSRHWQFVGQFLRLILAIIPVGLFLGLLGLPLAGAGPGAAPQLVPLAAAAFVSAGLIYGRLVLILPAVTVDRPLTLQRAWALTKGNSWRMFWLVVLPAIPIQIAGGLVSLILFQIHILVIGPVTPAGPLSTSLILNLFDQLVSFIGLGATVTVLSIVYKDLMARTAANAGPPATTA